MYLVPAASIISEVASWRWVAEMSDDRQAPGQIEYNSIIIIEYMNEMLHIYYRAI